MYLDAHRYKNVMSLKMPSIVSAHYYPQKYSLRQEIHWNSFWNKIWRTVFADAQQTPHVPIENARFVTQAVLF